MGNGMTHEPADAPFIVATRMPGFARGFSASAGGGSDDLNGAIPKGLGLADGTYAAMGKTPWAYCPDSDLSGPMGRSF